MNSLISPYLQSGGQRGFITHEDISAGLLMGEDLSATELAAHADIIVECGLTTAAFSDGQRRLIIREEFTCDGEIRFVKRILHVIINCARGRFFSSIEKFKQDCSGLLLSTTQLTEVRLSEAFPSNIVSPRIDTVGNSVAIYRDPSNTTHLNDHFLLRKSPQGRGESLRASVNQGRDIAPGSFDVHREGRSMISPPHLAVHEGDHLSFVAPSSSFPLKDDFETSDVGVQYLAEIRRTDAMDMLFPQIKHDQVLAIIFVAFKLINASAHKDLIDFVMAVKESGTIPNMENVSKTKVRGVIALLKLAAIIEMSGGGSENAQSSSESASRRLSNSMDQMKSDSFQILGSPIANPSGVDGDPNRSPSQSTTTPRELNAVLECNDGQLFSSTSSAPGTIAQNSGFASRSPTSAPLVTQSSKKNGGPSDGSNEKATPCQPVKLSLSKKVYSFEALREKHDAFLSTYGGKAREALQQRPLEWQKVVWGDDPAVFGMKLERIAAFMPLLLACPPVKEFAMRVDPAALGEIVVRKEEGLEIQSVYSSFCFQWPNTGTRKMHSAASSIQLSDSRTRASADDRSSQVAKTTKTSSSHSTVSSALDPEPMLFESSAGVSGSNGIDARRAVPEASRSIFSIDDIPRPIHIKNNPRYPSSGRPAGPQARQPAAHAPMTIQDWQPPVGFENVLARELGAKSSPTFTHELSASSRPYRIPNGQHLMQSQKQSAGSEQDNSSMAVRNGDHLSASFNAGFPRPPHGLVQSGIQSRGGMERRSPVQLLDTRRGDDGMAMNGGVVTEMENCSFLPYESEHYLSYQSSMDGNYPMHTQATTSLRRTVDASGAAAAEQYSRQSRWKQSDREIAINYYRHEDGHLRVDEGWRHDGGLAMNAAGSLPDASQYRQTKQVDELQSRSHSSIIDDHHGVRGFREYSSSGGRQSLSVANRNSMQFTHAGAQVQQNSFDEPNMMRFSQQHQHQQQVLQDGMRDRIQSSAPRTFTSQYSVSNHQFGGHYQSGGMSFSASNSNSQTINNSDPVRDYASYMAARRTQHARPTTSGMDGNYKQNNA